MKNSLITLLESIGDSINESIIDTNPFPHILLNTSIDDSTITGLTIMAGEPVDASVSTVGRQELPFHSLDRDTFDAIDKIGQLLLEKLDIKLPKLDANLRYMSLIPHIGMWIDSSELNISDIHLDFFKREYDRWIIKEINENTQTVISMHIYLPDDDTHSDLGTSLYSVPDSVPRIKADWPINIPTQIPSHMEKNCIKVKQIPFIRGNVFIHASGKDTWHQAPMVPEGYLRKSLMIRWEYNLLDLDLQ